MAPLFRRHHEHHEHGDHGDHGGEHDASPDAFNSFRYAGIEVQELVDDVEQDRAVHMVDYPGEVEPLGSQYARAHAWAARLCQRMADCVVAVAEAGPGIGADTEALLDALYRAVPGHLVRARTTRGVLDPLADPALPAVLPWPPIDPSPATSIGLYEALTRSIVDLRAEFASTQQLRTDLAETDAWRLTLGEFAAAEDSGEYALRLFTATENRSAQRKSHWILVEAFDRIARAGQLLACPSLVHRGMPADQRAETVESESALPKPPIPSSQVLASGAWNFTDPSVVEEIRCDDHRSNQLQHDYLEDVDPRESMRLLISLQTWEQQGHIERSGSTPHVASPWATMWRATCHLRLQAHTIAPGAVFSVVWQHPNPGQTGTRLQVIMPTQRMSAEPDVPPAAALPTDSRNRNR